MIRFLILSFLFVFIGPVLSILLATLVFMRLLTDKLLQKFRNIYLSQKHTPTGAAITASPKNSREWLAIEARRNQISRLRRQLETSSAASASDQMSGS